MNWKFWRNDLSGGLAAAFAGLPVELVYGLLAVAPLGSAYAAHGLRAALFGCVLAGFLGLVLRTTGGMIAGSRPAAGLILGSLAAMLLGQADIQATNDPAATVFILLLVCTSMAGLFQAILGVAGIGKALKYVPYPVIAGLMCGVGILMAEYALKLLFSVSELAGGSGWAMASHPLAPVVGLVTLATCFIAPRLTRRIPAVLIALVGGTIVHHALAFAGGAAYLGPVSGATQGLLPEFSVLQAAGMVPVILHWLPGLMPYAAAIAAFASLESLLCLAAIESARNERCNGDKELIRQGVTNIFGGILGATPSIGNLSRVMVNLSSGARTPLSGVSYSVSLGAIAVFAGSLFSWVPTAVTAGILFFYAQGMFDEGTRRLAIQVFSQRKRMPRAQYKSLVGNFAVIALVALVAAIGHMMQALAVGVVAAMALFVTSSMKPVIRQVSNARHRRSLKVRSLLALDHLEKHGDRIALIDIDGPLFFGTADRAAQEIELAVRQANWVILNLRRVNDIDATGARSLLRIGDRLAREEKRLLICGMNDALLKFLLLMGMKEPLHQENWFSDVDAALEAAEDELLRGLGVDSGTSTVSLSETPLADGLGPEEIGILRTYLTEQKLAAGQSVFRKGDTCRSLYVASNGGVDIRLPLSDQRYKRVASFAPGTVFGEMALLEGKPRSADAVVHSDTLVWEMTQEQLEKIKAEHPRIANQLMLNLSRMLAHRLRSTTQELANLVQIS